MTPFSRRVPVVCEWVLAGQGVWLLLHAASHPPGGERGCPHGHLRATCRRAKVGASGQLQTQASEHTQHSFCHTQQGRVSRESSPASEGGEVDAIACWEQLENPWPLLINRKIAADPKLLQLPPSVSRRGWVRTVVLWDWYSSEKGNGPSLPPCTCCFEACPVLGLQKRIQV